MIVTKELMKKIEKDSGLTSAELMERAGTNIAQALMKETDPGARILFLCGSGNNGGDGFTACRHLTERTGRVILLDGKPKTEEAENAYSLLSEDEIAPVSRLKSEIQHADILVDAVYGFGYHGSLSKTIRKYFITVNESGKPVYSIDINSGCECDSGRCERNAIRSTVTYALDCYKPFHMLAKQHHMFERVERIDMSLPHGEKSNIMEMDEEKFFDSFPVRKMSAYKGSEGKILLVGGCYGMAGAFSLNILGAETLGASFIHAACDDSIYPIAASRHLTPVFHPFGNDSMHSVIEPLIQEVKAIGFGSGAVYMPRKAECMDLLLQNSHVPVVLDAEALHLLHQNTYILKFVRTPVVLTPHPGEFSQLISKPVEAILEDPVTYALSFAKEYKVYLVLKVPNTIVVSPAGDLYINQSGNEALAQAGSGDLLTGMITEMLALRGDVFTAVCMAVYMHGHLADYGMKYYARRALPLEEYPKLMNELFMKHGF